ncbi:MAG TPA: prephenate dehydratase [Pirellulaceae bacterium]|nr:prephenate dehydratase [Pirellulaceae bacterium]
MSKKKSNSGGSVNSVRRELERLDRDLVRILSDRARATQKLGRLQQSNGQPLVDLLAEQETLERVSDANKGPLSPEALATIFRDILGIARALVKPLRIGYLGPKYSYSHIAAIQKFGDTPDLTPLSTIKAVFESLHFGQIDYGIVPLENSTDGRVVDTLDMFARLPTPVTGEVQVRIHHNLLGKCARSEVTEVYSKPQALSQCRDWLAKNLPGAKTIEMTSTAIAAQIAADKPGAAAVASIEAGMHYGLNVIDANIEDNKNNVTRFAVIGGTPTKRSGRDKTALMFEIPHKPGALADSMLVFKRGRLNLTWIESFPMPGSRNEYLFFVEFEGHRDDGRAKRALQALSRKTARLEVLGSYARSAPLESAASNSK